MDNSNNIMDKAFDPQLYLITNHTNMHVGSGKNSYGIVDNLIQRDILTSFPVINSSSLKGALRQFFHFRLGQIERSRFLDHVFGGDSKNENSVAQSGAYVFMSAHLLCLPVRSDTRPYYLATCPLIIEEFVMMLNKFSIKLELAKALENFICGLNGQAVHFEAGEETVIIENLDITAQRSTSALDKVIKELLGEHIVLLSNEGFMELTADESMPVMPRNSLENGISKNLWYEQVLPRQSKFYTLILSPSDDSKKDEFIIGLTQKQQLIQVGANASIGYGFCEFQKLN